MGTTTSLFCPLGHEYFLKGKGENARLRAEVASLRDRVDLYQGQRDSTERSLATTRGHMTRLKKRVAAGVCPCCNRTFQDLAKHMKGQHPKYVGS
jgi:hypothetical protein